MDWRNIGALAAIAGWGFTVASGDTVAQQRSLKEQLVGTWTLVSADTTAPDGTKTALFGADPKGILFLDARGHYAQLQVRPDRPRFKANNRLEGTAEENKAALNGAIGQFGTWSINEADKPSPITRTVMLAIRTKRAPTRSGSSH
jgi:hypothetical protein